MNLLKKIKPALHSHKTYIFWSCFAILALFKIFLVSDNEILALIKPNDDLWHILAASHAFWFAKEYTQITFIQYPVYPLFIFFAHFSGLPLRISIELLYILSGFLLSLSLIKAGVNKLIGIACFTLIIFQPVSFYLFDHTLAETLYAPLLLLSTASFIQLWIHRHKASSLFFSITTGSLFALLWLTRKESMLIAVFLFLVFLITLATSFQNKHFSKNTVVIAIRTTIIPSIIIFLFYTIICIANYRTFGIFAPSELDAPGYMSAYSALQKIQTQNTIRYVPVSSEAREIAYSISPSFQKLRPFLENKDNFAFEETKKYQGIDNEMAAGWFYWMLRDSVYTAGYTTAPVAEAYYNQVATEINSAIQEKKIGHRTVLFSFIDPSFYKYLPELPVSFFKISKLLVDTQEPAPSSDDQGLETNYKNTVDRMANRRAALVDKTQDQILTIRGWAFLSGEKISSVALVDASGKLLSSNTDFNERQDVKDFYKNDSEVPLNSGFAISYTGDDPNIQNGFLEFTVKDNLFKTPLNSLQKNTLTQIENGDILLLSIEEKILPESNTIGTIPEKIQQTLWKVYGNIILALSLITLVALTLSVRKIKYSKPDNLTTIIIFISFIIVTRLLLFSLVDISSWNGVQPRYIFPIMPLYGVLLLLILHKLFLKHSQKIAPPISKT